MRMKNGHTTKYRTSFLHFSFIIFVILLVNKKRYRNYAFKTSR